MFLNALLYQKESSPDCWSIQLKLLQKDKLQNLKFGRRIHESTVPSLGEILAMQSVCKEHKKGESVNWTLTNDRILIYLFATLRINKSR